MSAPVEITLSVNGRDVIKLTTEMYRAVSLQSQAQVHVFASLTLQLGK